MRFFCPEQHPGQLALFCLMLPPRRIPFYPLNWESHCCLVIPQCLFYLNPVFQLWLLVHLILFCTYTILPTPGSSLLFLLSEWHSFYLYLSVFFGFLFGFVWFSSSRIVMLFLIESIFLLSQCYEQCRWNTLLSTFFSMMQFCLMYYEPNHYMFTHLISILVQSCVKKACSANVANVTLTSIHEK